MQNLRLPSVLDVQQFQQNATIIHKYGTRPGGTRNLMVLLCQSLVVHCESAEEFPQNVSSVRAMADKGK